MEQQKNYLFKVLVVGCPSAGKTCCIRKTVFNQFNAEYKATIGVDFAAKSFKVSHRDQQITVSIQFWDIAGQEYYSQLSRAYYKGAYGCFIVCDLASETLIQDIKTWKDEVQSKVFLPGSSEVVPLILCCNKVDLPKAKDIWEMETIKQQIQDLQIQDVFATSAISGQGLEEAMSMMITKILSKTEKQVQDYHDLAPVVLPLEPDELVQERKKCC